MVLLFVVDGKETVYRNVTSQLYLNYVNGFMLMRNYSKGGELYQLKGKERRLLRKFGTIDIR